MDLHEIDELFISHSSAKEVSINKRGDTKQATNKTQKNVKLKFMSYYSLEIWLVNRMKKYIMLLKCFQLM